MTGTETGVEVVVAGSLCLDMFPSLGSLPPYALEARGKLFQIGGLRVASGGVVANTGLALHRLGAHVRLLAVVGDDLVGEATLEFLRRVGRDLSSTITIRPGVASSYTIVLSRPGEDRTFLHCTGPNDDFSLADVDFAQVDSARWFHFGYPSLLPRTFADGGRELAAILGRAQATGAITSLDFTLPDPSTPSGQADWPAILRLALPYVDVFVPSLEEAVYLLRRDLYIAWSGSITDHATRSLLDELAAELLSMGPAIAGLKLGAEGLLLYGADHRRLERLARHVPNSAAWAGQVVEQPAFQVRVLNTTGAGDAAYAGLILSALRGFTPCDAARIACAAGASSVEGPNAASGIASCEELAERLTAAWPTLPSRLLNV